jgi:hypothetical protein
MHRTLISKVQAVLALDGILWWISQAERHHSRPVRPLCSCTSYDGTSPSVRIPVKSRRNRPDPDSYARIRNASLRLVRCRGKPYRSLATSYLFSAAFDPAR